MLNDGVDRIRLPTGPCLRGDLTSECTRSWWWPAKRGVLGTPPEEPLASGLGADRVPRTEASGRSPTRVSGFAAGTFGWTV